MNVYILGANIKTTPIELREQLSFSGDNLIDGLKEIKSKPNINECIILSTCNRTELYIFSESKNLDRSCIENILCDVKKVDVNIFRKYFYFYSQDNAIYHLFKVTVGLDSMVIGEDQILGQVKEALKIAIETNCSGSMLNTLFRNSITSAKYIKTKTQISKIPTSVTSIALRKTYNILGDLNNKKILIIGLGRTGVLTINQLIDYKVKTIYVTNRTHKKSEEIAEVYKNTEVIEYNNRYEYLNDCDVIISSTLSPHYTITADLAKQAIKDNKQRIFIDLAVPRDIDGDIKLINKTIYINIDNLNEEIQNNQNKRVIEINKAEKIINKYILEFYRWFKNRKIYLEV